jgi:VCBS repeat-containing protein
MQLYLDGVLVDSDGYTGGLGTTSGGSGNIEGIAIGAGTQNSTSPGVTPVNQMFAGSIDEVAIFGGQLNGQTIQRLYDAGSNQMRVSENGSLNLSAGSGVLANDTDVDGDTLAVTEVNGSAIDVGSQITLASGALVTLNSDGSMDYAPNGQFESLKLGETATDTFNYTVSDGNGETDTATVTITIVGENDAPTVDNAIADQTATEGTPFSFQFASNVFGDVDGDALTYTSDASGWLSFDAATRTFSGTPLNADVGTTTVTVTANDGNGGTVSDTFDIVIGNTNDVPTVDNAIANQSATEDTPFSFQFASNVFGDVDGDTLTYTSDASGWLSFDAATRTFSGTPLNADVGTTTVTVTADDGNGGTISDAFDIVIGNANDAPTVANVIPDQVAIEDIAFSFQFASNTFNDVDGDTLTYTSDASGWLSFDAATRTFSGTPLNVDVGTTTVTVTADDGNGGTVSYTFDIVVGNSNDAPTVANVIPDQVATEDTAFSFQFASNTFNDADGDTLIYSSDASGWLSFDAATRTFSGTPLNADVGTTTVTVTADDGNGGTVSDTFDIVISNSNDAPAVANVIPDQVATEDSVFTFTFAANTFDDVDGDTLTYTSDASGWLSFDAATRTFSGTPLNADVGTTTVTVTADDCNGGTVSDTFDIVISNTNDAPTVANVIPDQVAIEDSAFTFTFAANTFNDTDGDTLTYTSDASGWLSFDAATRTFSGTPLNADVGTTTVTVTADDGNGGTVSDTFDIVISNSNDAPTVANVIPDQVATEDSAFTFTFAANTFNDTDGDTLTYTSDASGWLSFDAPTRTFSGTPLNADVGTTTVTVTADDGNGGTVSDTFDIVISNTNDAAVIGGVDTGTVTEDLDPDADALLETSGTLTIIDLDVGESSFNAGVFGGSYGVIMLDAAGNWAYAANTSQAAIQGLTTSDTLNDTITISSADGTPHDIVIAIMGTNDAPIAGNDVASVTEGGAVMIDVAANDSDIDSPLDLNSVTITGLPAHGSVVVNGDGTVTYSHDGSEAPVDSFSYSISDISGAFNNTATVTISVNPVNDAPAATDDAITVAEGNAVLIDLAANDSDVDNPLDLNSITIIGAPANGALSVNGDGTVTYTHDGSNTTSDSFSYSIADISGAISNTATVTINVSAVNDAPTTSGIADVTVDEDAPATHIDLNAAFADSDNLDSELRYSIVGNTDIGLFSAAGIDGNGQLTLAYAANMNGATQISIRATDPSGQSVDTLFTVNVTPVNDNPVLASNTGMVTTNGAPTTINGEELHVTDIDNPDTELVYTITALPANGNLMLNSVQVGVSDTFTQADLDNNRLVYVASGTAASDAFGFTVSDTDGGTMGNNTFNIALQLRPMAEKNNTTTTEGPVTAQEEPEVPQEQTVLESGSGGLVEGAGGYGGEFVPFGSAAVPPPPKLTPVLSLEPTATTELSAPRQVTTLEDIDIVSEVEDYELSTFAAVQVQSMEALWTSVDKMKQEMTESAAQMDLGELKVVAAKSSGVVLTAGIVAWAMRGGALLSSLMSTIPLWKGYDPLPILAYKDDEDEGETKAKDINEDMIPTSLDELKKLKELKDKARQYDVDALFGGSATREQ